MRGSLIIGKVAGIRVQVHWSFLLLIGWIIFVGLIAGTSTAGTIWNIIFVLVLFVCVVLHELGHALTAKRFNVQTQKITLLPIGGVASLEDMPEDPKQELLITLAGPAVNLLIALLLYIVIPFDFFRGLDQQQIQEFFSEISSRNFLFLLFYANLILAAFNFIPAFPMDGGRILRALLAMRMGRVQATQIAARMGQFVALLFFFFGLFYNPFLALIGVFVFFGAQGENILIQQLSILRGHRVRDAMMTNITILDPEDSLENVVDAILAGTERDFIVSDGHSAVGIVYNSDLMKSLRHRSNGLQVKDIMDKDFDSVRSSDDLAEIYRKVHTGKKSFFPVIENGRLLGAIDLTNINEFMVFKSPISY
ncbi:MAG TPA: site-2 protease family protein [Balneolaceae bacterium]|nr:site-2 protease family protein [Balneolaceae bacterium]